MMEYMTSQQTERFAKHDDGNSCYCYGTISEQASESEQMESLHILFTKYISLNVK